MGRYAITVIDECGNVSEYTFEIVKDNSGWMSAVGVISCLVLIGGAVLYILKNRGVI